MKKLLLIDDDPFSKKLLEELFRNEWKVISETLPDAVTQRIEEDVPRVVLLNASDKRVESQSLFDVIHKTHPSLPIIVYTNLSGLRVGRSMLKKGAFWHLSMPLNTDELTHVIQMALSFQQHRESALATRRDFDSLEKGIARMFQPLKGSFPKLFTFDQDGLLQGIVDLLADILQVDKVSLMLLNPDTGEMRIKAARGLSAYVIEHTTKRVGEGIAGWVAREGKPLLIKDVQHDPQFSESAFYHQYTTRSLICVPLKIEDRVTGVLSANNKFSGEPFDEDDLYMGTIFAHLLLLTLHNAQLHHDRERELQREAQIGTLNRKISAT
jgi:putative methionine-R-sulfoxide reductase with GAF domain/CheY-like chemotaxis protein